MQEEEAKDALVALEQAKSSLQELESRESPDPEALQEARELVQEREAMHQKYVADALEAEKEVEEGSEVGLLGSEP